MKVTEITKDMNIFFADYKHAERSYEFGKLDKRYFDWEFKEHKYYSKEYYDTLNIGDTGQIIREYIGEKPYMIYDCKIINKQDIGNIVLFEVYNMRDCANDILVKYFRKNKLKTIL